VSSNSSRASTQNPRAMLVLCRAAGAPSIRRQISQQLRAILPRSNSRAVAAPIPGTPRGLSEVSTTKKMAGGRLHIRAEQTREAATATVAGLESGVLLVAQHGQARHLGAARRRECAQ
jgi:hypothetical protein